MAFTDKTPVLRGTISVAGTSILAAFVDETDIGRITADAGFVGSRNEVADFEVIGKKDYKFTVKDTRATHAAGKLLVQQFFSSAGAGGAGDFNGYTRQTAKSAPGTSSVIVNPGDHVIKFSGAWADTFLCQCKASEPVEVSVGYLAGDRISGASAAAVPTAAAIAHLATGTIKLNSVAVNPMSFSVEVKQNSESDFNNNTTRQVVGTNKLKVIYKIGINVNATTWASYIQNLYNESTIPVQAIFANTGATVGFGFYSGKCKVRGNPPSPPENGYYTHELELEAYEDTDGQPIVAYVK